MKTITKNTPITEVMNIFPEAIEVFMESGMACIGCPAAIDETIEQGAAAHGINVEELLEKLKKRAEGKEGVKITC